MWWDNKNNLVPDQLTFDKDLEIKTYKKREPASTDIEGSIYDINMI